MGPLGREEPADEGLSVERERADQIAASGRAAACPYCGSKRTERAAEFGAFHMSETYFCKDCGSPFSRIKWDDPAPAER